ncbi:MAG TPA: hypothetical protein VKB51_13295 [bacterium]|nr:hypothetical protein [bacterium]
MSEPPRKLWMAIAAASAVLAAAVSVLLLVVAFRAVQRERAAPPPAERAEPATPSVAPGSAPGTAVPSGAACDVQRSAPLAFRSAKPDDTLRVTIQGAPCARAKLSIVVRDPSGAELYRYEAPFAPHLNAQLAKEPLSQAAEAFAESVLANAGIAGTTDQLPPWLDAQAYYSEHRDALKVDEVIYEALRKVRRPILWHATGAETWRSVVYDPQTRSGLVILAGGG